VGPEDLDSRQQSFARRHRISPEMALPPWLPDIGVFGPYTYLVTEVLFGSVALALLWRARALKRAGKTILALYPIAYVWDWYTLEVGVFAIELRTGIELLGIPIEEHIFMIVVPALIVGMHETIHGAPSSDPATGDRDTESTPRGDPDTGEERAAGDD
jgi:lycopene cyclase domain-containing protein